MNPTPPTVIRCSALTMYPDCPRRTAARLFWREISAAGFKLRHTPRGIGALIGSAVHRAAEVILREKAATGELPPSTVAADCAAQTLDDALAEGEVAMDPVTANRVEAEVQSIGMARLYHRVIAPEVEPILVEEPLEAEIAPGLVLAGRPDLVAREPAKVRDLKTSTRLSGRHLPQIGGYSLLARSNGLDIQEAAVDSIRRVATGKPQPEPVTVALPLAQAETAALGVLRHIVDDLRRFREGDPTRRQLPGDPWAFPANPASILCSARWCPAHSTPFCNEWRQARGRL